METKLISKCCNVTAVYDEKDDGSPVYTCLECEKDCQVNEVCEKCLGTGEVQISHDILVPCSCQKQEEDLDDAIDDLIDDDNIE